mmetsp:Transcript_6615/g.16001  ORF Transcript_6615/g.16001 Transcript_6615/m.16001 type:complete len:208 (-) Transcript_6615:52-675(-)
MASKSQRRPPVVSLYPRGAPQAWLCKKLKLLRHFESLLQPHAIVTGRPADLGGAEPASGCRQVPAGAELPHVRRTSRLRPATGVAWTEHKSKDGHICWHDKASGQTSGERPETLKNGGGGAGARAFRLSNGWLQLVFDNGSELMTPLDTTGSIVHASGCDASGGEYDLRAPDAATLPAVAQAVAHAVGLLVAMSIPTPPALAAGGAR